jgi:hypothetical protein
LVLRCEAILAVGSQAWYAQKFGWERFAVWHITAIMAMQINFAERLHHGSAL